MIIQPNGLGVLQERLIEIPNVHLEEVIGNGANGIVVRGRHRYLDRAVAVKFWVRLHVADQRNKFKQGIQEARKTAATHSSSVIQVFDAGEVQGVFYALMEYHPGMTLKEWLTTCSPRLSTRWHFARDLINEVCYTTSDATFHGDLHWRNIMVSSASRRKSPTGERESPPAFKMIDFGTSYFSSRAHSISRHWDIVNETFRRIMAPLDINVLFPKRPSTRMSADHLHAWYEEFLNDVPGLVGEAGASWLTFPVKQEARVAGAETPICVPVVESYEGAGVRLETAQQHIRRLVVAGALVLDPYEIGGFKEWYI